mgnify:CR=1 FL=1
MITSLSDSMNNFGALCASTKDCFDNLSNYFARLSDGGECQGKVMDALLQIPDLDLDEHQILEAGEIIASTPASAKFFFSLSNNMRKAYVRKKLGLM